MAQQVAEAACALQLQRTGHAPNAVTVILSDDTLVITLHGALTPAEQAMATNPTGAAKVQEFHRQLFANASDELRQAIKKITGVRVREAAAEVEPTTGAVIHAFTRGTMVQVFQLARNVPGETWSTSCATQKKPARVGLNGAKKTRAHSKKSAGKSRA